MLRIQSAEGEIFETWFMDTVFSGLKSSELPLSCTEGHQLGFASCK